MTDDYETTISFEKYEAIFWKKLNKTIDLENMGGSSTYKLKFYCATPLAKDMGNCIDSNGCLTTTTGFVNADDAFESVTFGLSSEFPSDGGFNIKLSGSEGIDIEAYEGIKGYYYNNRFYADAEHTEVIPYMNGHYHLDWTNYDPDVTGYGIVAYMCTNNAYTSTTKPAWLDYDGNILVKGIFLVKASNNFVIAYCRYSSYLVVRDSVTIPAGSKFVQVGGNLNE